MNYVIAGTFYLLGLLMIVEEGESVQPKTHRMGVGLVLVVASAIIACI